MRRTRAKPVPHAGNKKTGAEGAGQSLSAAGISGGLGLRLIRCRGRWTPYVRREHSRGRDAWQSRYDDANRLARSLLVGALHYMNAPRPRRFGCFGVVRRERFVARPASRTLDGCKAVAPKAAAVPLPPGIGSCGMAICYGKEATLGRQECRISTRRALAHVCQCDTDDEALLRARKAVASSRSGSTDTDQPR